MVMLMLYSVMYVYIHTYTLHYQYFRDLDIIKRRRYRQWAMEIQWDITGHIADMIAGCVCWISMKWWPSLYSSNVHMIILYTRNGNGHGIGHGTGTGTYVYIDLRGAHHCADHQMDVGKNMYWSMFWSHVYIYILCIYMCVCVSKWTALN